VTWFLTSAISNADRPRNCCGLCDGRYFDRITTIVKNDEFVDESRCDIAKDILDKLILDLDSDRVWKNADPLGASSKTSISSAAHRES